MKNSKRQRITLKRIWSVIDNNRGSAMITALAVGVVIAIFCLVTLLVSYTLYAQTVRRGVQLQCKNVAQTFAENLENELTNVDADLHKDVKERLENSESEQTEVSYQVKSSTGLDWYEINVELTIIKKTSYICDIEAVITCIKGGDDGADAQKYSVSREYESLNFTH